MSTSALNAPSVATILVMKDELFKTLLGAVAAVAIALSGWTLRSVVEDEKAAARVETRVTALEAETKELKDGPSRREWDDLKLTLRNMSEKLDKLLGAGHR